MDYRLLGPVEVWSDDAQLPVGGPTSRAILTMLALSAGRMVSADRLMAAAWGDELPATVSAQLHNRISRLRRSLSQHGDVIVRRADGYLLDVAQDRVDAIEFQRLAAQAREATAPEHAARRADLLHRALATWRGPALEGVPRTPVVAAEAARLDELRLGVTEERIEADLVLGRLVEVVGELTVLVAEHPLRERLRGLLMIALYRSGRQADALATYQAGRKLLIEELGVEPGPELRRIEGAVLACDPALDAATAARIVTASPPPAAPGSGEASGEASGEPFPVLPTSARNGDGRHVETTSPPRARVDASAEPAGPSGRRRGSRGLFTLVGLALGLLLGIPVGLHVLGGPSHRTAGKGPHFSLVLFAPSSRGGAPVAFWTDDQRCGNADEYRLTYDLPTKGKDRASGYRLTHADCGVKLFDGSGGSGYGEPLLPDGRFHPLDARISGRVVSVVAYSCCNGRLVH